MNNKDVFYNEPASMLVFAVAGRIGSGASFVKEGIAEELKAFGYTAVNIDITDLFLEQSYLGLLRTGVKDDNLIELVGLSKSMRIKELQRRGNFIRQQYHSGILAAFAIEHIAKYVSENAVLASNSRVAFLIDSLKHPEEVELLRSTFRKSFCMVGVVADDSIRRKRLHERKHVGNHDFDEISELDANDKKDGGQRALNTILKSDYFFANNYGTSAEINTECRRLLNLLFESEIVTPRGDEYGMEAAFAAADKSACLSRQVGAAVISQGGDVLATGYNDVPKYGGGLYTSESNKDERCYARSGFCYNDDEKRIIAEEIMEALSASIKLKPANYERLKNIILKNTRLNLLIEFSRAVHAEMDAIITAARNASLGLVGSTLFVTTYPCHNCAKQIIAAGIKRVVFLEPYVKSLAQKLHSDAINNPLESPNPNKVTFDNYGGVAPSRYADFFSMAAERKSREGGVYLRKGRDKDNLSPIGATEVFALEMSLQVFSKQLEALREQPSPSGAKSLTIVNG